VERATCRLGHVHIFLGAFAKLLKVTIGFIMFVSQSYRIEETGSHLTDFYEFSYWTTFQESVEKIQVSLKI
jgi:hypothetical protein